MKKYRVVTPFRDLQDNKHQYSAGDIFPREGVGVSDDRIKELSSNSNKRGVPLIKAEGSVEPIKRDIPKEPVSEPEEKPVGVKTDFHPSKPTKTKKSKEKV